MLESPSVSYQEENGMSYTRIMSYHIYIIVSEHIYFWVMLYEQWASLYKCNNLLDFPAVALGHARYM